MRCIICGKRYPPTPDPPERFHATCSALPCIHLGPERRREECDSCNGSVQIKVYACAVHGECAKSAKLKSVIHCPCNDYRAPISCSVSPPSKSDRPET